MELQGPNAGQAEHARLKATYTADHEDLLSQEALWPHQTCTGPMHRHCLVRAIRAMEVAQHGNRRHPCTHMRTGRLTRHSTR